MAIIIIIALTLLTSLIEYADPLPSYHTGKTMPESWTKTSTLPLVCPLGGYYAAFRYSTLAL